MWESLLFQEFSQSCQYWVLLPRLVGDAAPWNFPSCLTTRRKNLLTIHNSIIWSSLHLWPWAITIVESLQRIYSLPVADTVYCRRPPKFYFWLRQIKLFSWWIYQTQLLLLLLLLPTYNFINIWCEVISATKVYFYTGNPNLPRWNWVVKAINRGI